MQRAPLPEDCVYFTPTWLPLDGYRHLGRADRRIAGLPPVELNLE
ncbi:hypothetical protein [Ralstonia pickettii]|nr:hypothetical protein N234_35650 [Ralstonia pickettii DTP0602]